MPTAAALTHQWISAITAGGAVTQSQPGFSDISGSLAASQMPALTGDVTSSAGAVATTAAATQNNISSIPNLATVGTITSGTWSGTIITVPKGGTGLGTLTNHGVLVGAGTGNITQLAAPAAGTLLTGQGSSADPSFSSTPTLGIAGTTEGQLKLAGSTAGTLTQQANVNTTDYTMTWPAAQGGASTTVNNDGSGNLTWVSYLTNPTSTVGDFVMNDGSTLRRVQMPPYGIWNCSIATSVAASALTISLKDAAGTNPSATSPCAISFRNATAATGTTSTVIVTSATSLTVASGATLGSTNAVDSFLYVYAINNAGTIELGVMNFSFLDEGVTNTSTALTGASNSAYVFYSTTLRSSKAVKLLGRVQIQEATAGTWNSNATTISNPPFGKFYAYRFLAFTSGSSATYTVDPGVTRIKVRFCGGGGGGQGSGTAAVGNGTNGGAGGGGGSASGGDINFVGTPGGGGGGGGTVTGTIGNYGGAGGASPFGGSGPGGNNGPGGGTAASGNSCSGGGAAGGKGGTTGFQAGIGGGAGGYIELNIYQPAASYTYTVGAKGTGGIAGTGGAAGADAGAGLIAVEEYWQ